MASYTVSFGSRSAIFIEKESGVLHRKSENDLFPAVLSLDQANVDYKVERLAHFIERTANESQATFLRECRLLSDRSYSRAGSDRSGNLRSVALWFWAGLFGLRPAFCKGSNLYAGRNIGGLWSGNIAIGRNGFRARTVEDR